MLSDFHAEKAEIIRFGDFTTITLFKSVTYSVRASASMVPTRQYGCPLLLPVPARFLVGFQGGRRRLLPARGVFCVNNRSGEKSNEKDAAAEELARKQGVLLEKGRAKGSWEKRKRDWAGGVKG
jgi:hypothetical protein